MINCIDPPGLKYRQRRSPCACCLSFAHDVYVSFVHNVVSFFTFVQNMLKIYPLSLVTYVCV